MQKTIKAECDEQREQCFGDGNPGEQIKADGRGTKQAGHDACAITEHAPRPNNCQGNGKQQCEQQGKARGSFGDAEQVIVAGDQPVKEWRLFEITNAIDVKRYPIPNAIHLSDCLGMGCVSIVEQRGRE